MIRLVYGLSAMMALATVPALAQETAPAPPAASGGVFVLPAMPGGNGLVTVLRRAEVQSHLHMTVKQKADLADLLEGPQAIKVQASHEGPVAPSPEEMKQQLQDQFAKQTATQEQRIKDALKPDQFARLREIALQWRGALSLGDTKTAETLKVSPEHRQQIGQISNEYERQKAEVIRSYAHTEQQGDGNNRAVMVRLDAREYLTPGTDGFKKLSALKADAESKILAVLSPEEKDSWRAAQGEPFTFRSDTPNNRF